MRASNRLLLAGGAVAALVLGCGKAEYEAEMKSQVDKLAFASNFLDNLYPDPTPVIRGVASLQLPKFIEVQPNTQAPFVPLPGHRVSYTQFIDLGGRDNTQPVYCYFASVPTAEQPQAAILAEIKRSVAAKFKGGVWQDVSFDTPDGGKLAFKKMSVSGTQNFPTDENSRDTHQLPGQLDIYVHSAPGYHIVVAFRATEEAAARTGVFQNAPYALGTLVVEAAEDDQEA